jgi:hypothetical protein
VARPALVGAQPVAEQLAQLASRARVVIRNLRLLLVDLQKEKGIENFVDLLFHQTLSFNGFDEVGHYLRNNLIVTICSGYSITPTVGCSANFQGAGASSASSSTASVQATSRRLAKILGLDPDKGGQDKSSGSGSGSGNGGGVRHESAPLNGKGASGGGESKPKASSPSQPPPKTPPAAGQGDGNGDGLVDYLLGGAGK